MTRIHRKLEYSLLALQHMSEKPHGSLSTAKEVAEKFAAPFDATARVLQLLAQKGVLRSEQGANGGYALARDLAQLNLEELMGFIQGPLQIAKCLQGEEPCEIRSSCSIVAPIDFLNQRLGHFYRSISVAELLAVGKTNGANHASYSSKEVHPLQPDPMIGSAEVAHVR